MSSYQIKFSDLVSPTRLYEDYLQGRMVDLNRYNFLDQNAVLLAAADIDNHSYDREAIYGIVRDANKDLEASQQTLANIELLKKPETLCVFAGQQTSVCANPMYIIYKAMTAIKLSKRYASQLKRPVVSCFWMATDDHDFEEVRNANFLDRSGNVLTATYKPAIDPSGLSIANIILDEGVHDFCSDVDRALIDTEFKKPMLDKFREYYRPGLKLSQAFARVFNRFLGDWGVILVDPNFPGMKNLFKPIFEKEILEYKRTFELYEQRSNLLQERGYHVQVHKSGENLNIFYHTPKRSNIVIDNDQFRVDGTDMEFTSDKLVEDVEQNPGNFSSNVLLRPIAQCQAFPTLAHVVGPSELAYFAQIEPLFEFFGVPFPIAYPRSGMTIVEPQIKRILEKYEIGLPELKNDLEFTLGAVVEKLFPSEAAGEVISISDRMKRDLDKVSARLENSDPEGSRHIDNFQKRLDYELKQLGKKLKSSNKKRHDELTGQIRRASSFLFPDGGLQERLISPVYYVNKFGPAILKDIYDNLEIDNPGHCVLEL